MTEPGTQFCMWKADCDDEKTVSAVLCSIVSQTLTKNLLARYDHIH